MGWFAGNNQHTYISSSGEMKMSLRQIILFVVSIAHSYVNHQIQDQRTFSWRKCFKSFSSRYVLLDRTGVLKGFIIFLTATGAPVN